IPRDLESPSQGRSPPGPRPGNFTKESGVEWVRRGIMSHPDPVPPPVLCRWQLRIAGRLAPPAVRREFRERWDSRLANLCILVDRGEVAGGDRAELRLLLVSPDGSAVTLPLAPPSSPDLMTTQATGLGPGTYRL